jgi:hypothetical protein
MSCTWKHVVCKELCEPGKSVCAQHLRMCAICLAPDEQVDITQNELCSACLRISMTDPFQREWRRSFESKLDNIESKLDSNFDAILRILEERPT